MSERVLAAAAALRRALAALDLDALTGWECVELVGMLATTEKACAGARARAAVRAAAAGAHRSSGFRDAADWLAKAAGSSAGEAKAALATAAALDGCPQTRAGVAAGELSLAQAREITRAEADRPGCEAELVGLARRSTLGALRDEARRRRFAAVDPEELHARQQAAREVRHWRDELGMVCGRFALPPEIGVPFANRLDAETDRIRRHARRSGRAGRTGPASYPEPREAHAADAFAALVGTSAASGTSPSGNASTGPGGNASAGGNTGPGRAAEGGQANAAGDGRAGNGRGRRGRSADLVIVCDLRAWRRGHTHPGEPCHLIGGTPLPVPVARRLGEDAFLEAVLHDGTRIHTVAHYGRHIPAPVRTALDLGPPPHFDGAVCVEAGCGRRHGLEWDHIDPLANRGPTTYANLAARCWPHHHDKTDRDRAAGLLGAYAQARTGPDPP